MNLSRLTDRELIHHAWMSTNALTSTELETHLLVRDLLTQLTRPLADLQNLTTPA